MSVRPRIFTGIVATTLVAACSAAPEPARSSAATAAASAAPSPSVVEAPTTPPTVAPTATSSAVANEACFDARLEGPIGDCIAPSLVIDDSCEHQRYTIHFDDCHGSKDVNVTGFRADSRVEEAFVAAIRPGPPATPRKIVAIRGGVGNAHVAGSGARFSIDVDVDEGGGAIVTKHLQGKIRPEF